MMIQKQPMDIYLALLEKLFLEKFRKHTILTQSTIETEIIALATASEEAEN